MNRSNLKTRAPDFKRVITSFALDPILTKNRLFEDK